MAIEIIDDVVKLFRLCKDQEFIDADDSDERTLSYHILEYIMDNYIQGVSMPCITTEVELYIPRKYLAHQSLLG